MTSIALAALLAGDPDTLVTLDFADTPLSEVVETLSRVSEVPIELDEAARKMLGDPAKVRISVKLNAISVTGAAKLLFGPRGLDVQVVDRTKLRVSVPR